MNSLRYRKKSIRIGAVLTALILAVTMIATETGKVFGADQSIQPKAVSTTSVIKPGSNTVNLTGCVKGKEYALIVVKGSYKNYSTAENNIVYIDQKTATDTSVQFSFPLTETSRVVLLVSSNDGAGKYPIVIGEANIPLSEATVAVSSKTYNAKTQTASVSSAVYRGSKLNAGTDFTVSGGGKNVGTYTATIKGKGRFTGTVTKKFNINPVGTSLASVKAGKKKITVKWKKPAAKYKNQMKGYQIQYSLYSNFKNAKTVSGGGYAKKSKVIKGLKSKKKYYVRVRTYKGQCYSAWSKAKAVKVK